MKVIKSIFFQFVFVICVFAQNKSLDNYFSTDTMQYGSYNEYWCCGIVNENIIINKGELQLIAFPDSTPKRFYADSTKGMLVYLINGSDSLINILKMGSYLEMLQEAQDTNGLWRPIEYIEGGTSGSVYLNPLKLDARNYVTIAAKRYKGNYKTLLRFKLHSSYDLVFTIYSNTFEGSINLEQFILYPVTGWDLRHF